MHHPDKITHTTAFGFDFISVCVCVCVCLCAFCNTHLYERTADSIHTGMHSSIILYVLSETFIFVHDQCDTN